MLTFVKNFFHKDPGLIGGVARSPEWTRVRAEYLKKHPVCEITGSKKKLTVHHKLPYHTHPEFELDQSNLITLSEDTFGSNIHLIFGHLGNYRSWNENIEADAKEWHDKIINRPI